MRRLFSGVDHRWEHRLGPCWPYHKMLDVGRSDPHIGRLVGANRGRRPNRRVGNQGLEREVCRMRFRKLFPALTIALAVALGACAEEGAEEGEEMEADTMEMAPAPEPA